MNEAEHYDDGDPTHARARDGYEIEQPLTLIREPGVIFVVILLVFAFVAQCREIGRTMDWFISDDDAGLDENVDGAGSDSLNVEEVEP